jgi:hypothetical protein
MGDQRILDLFSFTKTSAALIESRFLYFSPALEFSTSLAILEQNIEIKTKTYRETILEITI